jgi:signal transduction histidine kinase
VVFIGSVLDESIDFVVVPRIQVHPDGRRNFLLPGVTALAAVTETLLRKAPLRDASWIAALLWNILWVMLTVMFMPRGRPIQAIILLFGFTVLAVVATGSLHSIMGFVLPTGLLLGCLLFSGVYTIVDSHFQTSRELFLTLQRSHQELEKKVLERTEDLRKSNEELNQTLHTLKSTQAQLVQSGKMASLGSLVAGIAHEVNNPIGAVNSMADVTRRYIKKLKEKLSQTPLNDDDTIVSALSVIDQNNDTTLAAGQRIAEITQNLKKFAHLDEAEYQEVDIHEGINETISLFEYEYADRIKVGKNYADLPKIGCYPRDLNQVFMNLLINAGQAIESHGTVMITTQKDNTGIHIKFTDSGTGIPVEIIDHIFDPGFTTRGVGVGTGLGLSISYNIIERHKGSITVESEEGHGTTFTITLPFNQEV